MYNSAFLCWDVVLMALLVHCEIAQGVQSGSGYYSGTSGYSYSGSNNSPPPPPVVTCPDSCSCMSPSMVRCEGRRGIETLSFRGFDLTNVPIFQGNYPDLEMIDLNNNRIREIRSGAFTAFSLPQLEHLVLANNAIEVIENGAFQLNGLVTLDLSNNFLETLREDAFQILNGDFSTLIIQNNLIREVQINPNVLNRDNLPFLFVFVAGNPLFCNRDEPLASPPTIIALCVGEFFGSDMATCIYETPIVFDVIPLETFCNLVYEEMVGETTTAPPEIEITIVAPFSSETSIFVIVGATVGGVVALIVLVLCPICIVLVCIRLKKWEKKFNEVTIQNAERNLQIQHRLNPYIQPEQLSPRYARGPIASLPPLPGEQFKKKLFPAPPGVRQFQNNTYDPDSEEIYEHIDEHPLPSPPGEVEYGDNYYILNVATIPQKSPSSTCASTPVVQKRIVEAEINYSPHRESSAVAHINSDHESDDESPTSDMTTKTLPAADSVDKSVVTEQREIQQASETQEDTKEKSTHDAANEEAGMKSPKYVNTGSSWASKKEFVPKPSKELGLTKMETEDMREVEIEEQEVAYLSVVL